MEEWRQITGVSQSTIEHAIGKAERLGFIERERPGRHHDRGGYRLQYGNFGSAPLSKIRTRTCKPREIAVRAPEALAALRQPQFDAVTAEAPRPQLIAVEPQADAAQAAMHCTLPGGCPYILKQKETANSKNEGAGRQAEDVTVEASLPACLPNPQSNREHKTPQTATGEQILRLPSVQKLQHKLSDTLGPKLLKEIVTQLGDGALEDFDKRLLLKMESTKSLARLPSIAADVRRSHELRAIDQRREAESATRQRQEEQSRFIAETKAQWDRIPESDRQLLREVYPEINWG
jgi:hypothetical protein